MTRNITKEMEQSYALRKLMREKRLLSLQREGLILLSLVLAMALGGVLILI